MLLSIPSVHNIKNTEEKSDMSFVCRTLYYLGKINMITGKLLLCLKGQSSRSLTDSGELLFTAIYVD